MTDLTEQAIISQKAEEIEKGAFCNDGNIKAVTVPSNICRIGEDAFRGCSNLKTVVLQEGLQEIGPFAFWCCKKLETIVIPASVRIIHEKAFGVCEGLKRVTVLSEKTVFEDGVFIHCDCKMELRLPEKLRVDQRLHLFGRCFLYSPRIALPPKAHSENHIFKSLVDRCSGMDTDAMWEMADYLQGLGTEDVYTCAADFWR